MASGVVNIRRDVDDKFYRYRMPLLMTKIEGKGNGIKTVIPNMSDVARALSRPPTYPTKFFGSELGAQTSIDEKNDRFIVNGAHDAARLRELLDAFIDKFVLCGACKNPETDLILTKNDMIVRDCKACGVRSNVDMRHKLTTYIVKNPPKKKGKRKKGEHAEAPSPAGLDGNGSGENGRGSPEDDDEGGGTDDELTKRLKAEAAELNPEATLEKEDWSADTSPEAVKARMGALQAGVAGLTLGNEDDSDEDADSPYSQLGRWVQENREASAVEVFKKVQELGLEKKHKAVQVLAQTLLTENALVEIPKYAPVFVKMISSEKHQKSLLGGIERLAGLTHPELIPAIPKILMAFYQVDVLDEEVVKQWGTHVSKKYVDKDTSKKVRKASEPFLKWLDEAEDDDDEEDDD
ncbi:eukaryotic translation initiation factor 5 [Dentipellis sp. KUC8613]|nr:eukaryotic translation initiation factor 5 [Dentipellis sp. KUC8613]